MRPRKLLSFAAPLIFLSVTSTAIAQRPELVVQTGHGNSVVSIAYSPDGKYLASSGDDGSIVIWETENGRQIQTFENKGNKNHVTISSNGKILSAAKEVKIWDIATGEELKFKDASAPAALSRDGTILAVTTGYMNDKISLLDVSTSKVLRTFDGCSRQSVLTFSPDGKIMAGACDPVPQGNGTTNEKIKLLPGKIKLWDVDSGKELRTLEGHELGADSIVFTTDNKSLISTSEFDGVKFWNVNTGKLQTTIKVGGKSLALSPDGQTLAIGPVSNGIVLWDVVANRKLRDFQEGSFNALAFSPDSRVLATGRGDQIRLLDITTSKEVGVLKKHSQDMSAIALSQNGRMLATGSAQGDVVVWDLIAAREPRRLPNQADNRSQYLKHVGCLAFSSDNRFLARGGGYEKDGELIVWEIETGKMILSLRGDSVTEVTALAFGSDNKTLVSWHGAPTIPEIGTGIRVWNVVTGNEVRKLGGDFSKPELGLPTVILNPNGDMAAIVKHTSNAGTPNKVQSIELWDLNTATKIRSLTESDLEDRSIYSYHIQFSPDGKSLARVVNFTETYKVGIKIRLWNIDTGVTQDITSETGFNSTLIAMNPNGELLAIGLTLSGSKGRQGIKIFNVKSGTELSTLADSRSWSLHSMVFTGDSKYIIAGTSDNAVRLMDVNRGDELARLIGVDEKDWLVVSPEGLFDGSSQGWQKSVWRFSQKTSDYAPVETYFREFYYPNLLGDVVAGKRPRPTVKIEELDRRQPQLKLTMASGDATSLTAVTTRIAKVKIQITDAPAGARDLRLFRNGSLIKFWAGELQPNQDLIADVSIVAGENHLTAYAFNRSNIKSSDVTLNVTGDTSLKRDAMLYVVTIGVGQYANSQYNLNYTVADAQAFGDEVKREQEKLGRYQRIEVIPLFNEDATKANILAALKKLAGTAQPEDGVIVYFSGHGTAQKDRFYLIPHDLGYMGSREQLNASAVQTVVLHSISDVELEESFRGIDAGQLLLVIDACNSGQALQAEDWRRGPMNTKGLAQLAYEKGMYVLTASQSIELAYESEALKHSYMTYALVEEGLKSKVKEADANNDGQVWLREWFDYAVQRVPRMREDKIEQTAKQQNKSLDLVEVAEQGKVQTPRVFYRREPDAQPWVVARTK